jgi:hypothetical protein
MNLVYLDFQEAIVVPFSFEREAIKCGPESRPLEIVGY